MDKNFTNPFAGFYLDLDGVFADFNGRIKKLTGKEPHQIPKSYLWATVHRDRNFFYNLELMDGAEKLWSYARRFNPTFLTGLPAGKDFKEQKIRWVGEKFGSEWEVIVLPKALKKNYSGPNKILIDDTPQNIEQWVSKGGLGVLHEGDVDVTIAAVEELRLGY